MAFPAWLLPSKVNGKLARLVASSWTKSPPPPPVPSHLLSPFTHTLSTPCSLASLHLHIYVNPVLSFQGLPATAPVHLCTYLAITDQYTPSFHNLPEIPCTPFPLSPDFLSSYQTKHSLPWPVHHLHRASKDLHHPPVEPGIPFPCCLRPHMSWVTITPRTAWIANISGAVKGHYTIKVHHLVMAISVLTAVVSQGLPVCLISSLTSLTFL